MDINTQILSNNIETSCQHIEVYSCDGVLVGTVPEPYLRSLGYFKSLISPNFSEGITKKKTITLLDGYFETRARFFCDVVKTMHFRMKMYSGHKLVWLYAMFDDYVVNDQLVQYILDRNYGVGKCVEAFAEMVRLYNTKDMGLNIEKLHTEIKKGLADSYESIICRIDQFPLECFTYAFGRNIVCDIIDKCRCDNETLLFQTLVEKITEINKFEHKLSRKAVFDLLAKIRWFYVDQNVFEELWKSLSSMYLDLHVPKKISNAFIARNSAIKSYATGDSLVCSSTRFLDYPPRSDCCYSRKVTIYNTSFSIYSTTLVPVPVEFSVMCDYSKKTKMHYIKISCDNKDSLPWVPQVRFNLVIQNQYDDRTEIINKTWTFHKFCKLPVSKPPRLCEIRFLKIISEQQK